MANTLWLKAGAVLVNGSGVPIYAPQCPCDAICDYCCDPALASSYQLTFSDAVALTSDCASHTFGTSITVTYVGSNLYGDGNCNWQSTPVDLGGGWYAWARLDYTPADGTVTIVLAIADSDTMGSEYDLCYALWAGGTHPCDPTGATDIAYYGASSQGTCTNCACADCAYDAGPPEIPGITVSVS